MISKKINFVRKQFVDERSNEVIFVSHCILNENTRYYGGACEKGFNLSVIEQICKKGYGIVQLSCPEKNAWGGIQKQLLWAGIDSKGTIVYSFRRIISRLFLWHTKRSYKRIALNVMKEIKSYLKAGYRIKGIIGVGGSPTCGVYSSIDLTQIDAFTTLSLANFDRISWNNYLYSQFLLSKKGLFIEILDKMLEKKKISIPFYEFDIPLELKKEKQIIFENQSS